LKSKFRSSSRLLVAAILVVVICTLISAPARAQDYTWTLSFMGGLGGSLSDGGSNEAAFQVGFGLQFEPEANVLVHVGQVDFDTGSLVGELADGTISYINVGGEYQFSENYYDSGVFLGLGLYEVAGRRVLTEGVLEAESTDTAIGLVIGATGEFKITPAFVFLVEISGHILDSDDIRVLGTGFVGFGFHF